jgi:hypothetical protein
MNPLLLQFITLLAQVAVGITVLVFGNKLLQSWGDSHLTPMSRTLQTIEVNTNSRVANLEKKIDDQREEMTAMALAISGLRETLASERAMSGSYQAAVATATALEPPETKP